MVWKVWRVHCFCQQAVADRANIHLPSSRGRPDGCEEVLTYTVLGSLPWCFGLAYVGVFLGPHWSDLEALFRYLDIVVIAGIIGLFGYLIYHRKRIVNRMHS